MSVTDSSLGQSQTETVRCKRCNSLLPRTAAFCGQCGERVEKSSDEHVSPRRADITDRYRITSLLRRQPPAQLLLALDTQQQRPVVIHDIDMSNLAEPEHTQVVDALQQEYDLLRQQRIPAIMPLVELRHHNGHLYVISGWPFALHKPDKTPSSSTRISHMAAHQLSTLQDLLQSGLGLPEPEIALQWIYRLSRAIEQLHRQEILIGNIDPQTILISQHDYSGEPVLVVSWFPDLLYKLLPTPSNHHNPSPFLAPEALQGSIEPRSDIYSLGAILYLLLTGIPPDNAQERRHRTLSSLLEHDPYSSAEVNTITMQAMALEPEQRFAQASDFSDALAALLPKAHTGQASNPSRPGKGEREIHIASTSVDNKTGIANRTLKAGKSYKADGPDEVAFMEEPEDVTISIVPLQAQMARRYLSRIKTGKLEINEQFSGEAPVEEGSNAQHPPFEHIIDERDERDERDEHDKRGKRRQREREERKAIIQTDIEEGRASSSYNDDIAQHETILIKTDDVKVATAVIGEASNPARQTRSTTIPGPASLKTRQEEQEKETPQVGSPQTAKPQAQKDPQENPPKDFSLARFKALITGSLPAIPRLLQPRETLVVEQAEDEESLLKRGMRMLLGEHAHSTSAAALIETPMRVQPHQNYIMRINVIGRSAQQVNESGGLSALSEGDTVHIEVRSALYQNYAYLVQQADVQIPAEGYVAEVAMPMQPLGSGPSGRRERLHVFFMDAEHNPLYEKPFVLELFISHLVHSGREGHNVLSIPL